MLCAQEYSFRYFGNADGLNNLVVLAIYEDRTGFFWVSTQNGIFRFDGVRFQPYGLGKGIPANSFASFGEAPDGSLLVGGEFGLYHLLHDRFEKLTLPFNSVSPAQGIQADGKGRTFVSTGAGLVELSSQPGHDGFEMRSIPRAPGTSNAATYGIFLDGGNIWYGCGLELCRLASGGTRVYGRENDLPSQAVVQITKDHDGNLWVSTDREGVFELEAGQSKFKRPGASILSTALGGYATADADGRILLPSPDGLFIQRKGGWERVGRVAGLRGSVNSVYEDRQHSLWIGLGGRGLALWRGYREWETYSAGSGLGSDAVYEILPRADGTIWAATEAGLYRAEHGESGIQWKQFSQLGNFPARSLQTGPSGDLWVGTFGRGVARVHLSAGSLKWLGEPQGLMNKSVYILRFDRDHRLWAGTAGGLFVSDPPYLRFSQVAQVPAERIWTLAEGTDGTLWAGGADGLFEQESGGWRRFTRASGLTDQAVLSLGAGPNGAIWVGYRYGGGIDRVHARPDGLTVERGLQRPGSNGIVYFLDFDAKGRLWAGTERGVDVWDGARWSHYDTDDGLAWNDCDLNAFAEEPNGTIWIGTSGGLSRFTPRARSGTGAPLTAIFTRVTMGRNDISGLVNPSFRRRANSLSVGFSALNAPRQNEVVFRYRLQGAQSAWTETSQRELEFANLAPGRYRLEVEAQDSDEVWSEHRAEFAFIIRTPWYESWWFVGLCALLALSGAAGVLRLRMLAARNREKELVRLVEEKTFDLKRANEELERLSFTDPLTGLGNRRLFDQTLESECARMTRTGSKLSLVSIDVDHFKSLNDSAGHQKGDEYLIQIAKELTRIARRRIDAAVRCGGEEFSLILPETDATQASIIAESVRLAIADLQLPHPASPVAAFLTVSVGVATATLGGWSSPNALAAAADWALYRAKQRGRNCVVSAQPTDSWGEMASASILDPS